MIQESKHLFVRASSRLALVAERTVMTSLFSTSTLPCKSMWWRVRTNDVSGNAGTRSTVRRFRVD